DVVATSTSLHKGLEIVQNTPSSVILLDVNMPYKGSKSSVEQLLRATPLPIIMLADICLNQTAKTIQAMTNGAVDFIKINQKNQSELDQKNREIFNKIKSAARVKSLRSIVEQELDSPPIDENRETVTLSAPVEQSIIAIGASTGGPRALQQILQTLP